MNDDRSTPTEAVSNPPAAAQKPAPVEKHPEFKPAPSAPADPADSKTRPRTKKPWQPKAAITTGQVNDVLRAAMAANQFRFDQVVAHRNDAGPLRIVKLAGKTATVRAPDNSLEEYPVAELFDPEVAEKMAVQLTQKPGETIAAPAKSESPVANQSPGTGPASTAVTLLVAAAIAFMSLFGVTACETNSTGTGTVSGTTEQSKAASAIQFAEDHAQPLTTAAVTAFLLTQRDPATRATDAKYIYAGAQALNIFTAGTVPTADQLEATVKTFLKGDPRYNELAAVIVAQYANVYPLFGIAGKSPTKLFIAIENGAMNGAKPFLPSS